MTGLRTTAVAASLALASLFALLRTLDDRDLWQGRAEGESEVRQALEERIAALEAAGQAARAEARVREAGLQGEVERARGEASVAVEASRSLAEVKARLTAAETALAAESDHDRPRPVASVRPPTGIDLVAWENPWTGSIVMVRSDDPVLGAPESRAQREAELAQDLAGLIEEFHVIEETQANTRLILSSKQRVNRALAVDGPPMNQGVGYVAPAEPDAKPEIFIRTARPSIDPVVPPSLPPVPGGPLNQGVDYVDPHEAEPIGTPLTR